MDIIKADKMGFHARPNLIRCSSCRKISNKIDTDLIIFVHCRKLIPVVYRPAHQVGLPRLEKTVNVYMEGTNRNIHVYTSITH